MSHAWPPAPSKAAVDASLLLVQEALVQICAMAYRRENLGAAVEPGDDYHERIRMIADVCENLPGHLRASSPGTPLEGVQYAWDKADDHQRKWLQAAMRRNRVDLGALITGHVNMGD